MRWLKNIMREPLPLADDPFNATASTLTIAALESALMKSNARLAQIQEVWEKYNPHTGSYWTETYVTMCAYGSSEHDSHAVFQECWQAIRKAMEDQP